MSSLSLIVKIAVENCTKFVSFTSTLSGQKGMTHHISVIRKTNSISITGSLAMDVSGETAAEEKTTNMVQKVCFIYLNCFI